MENIVQDNANQETQANPQAQAPNEVNPTQLQNMRAGFEDFIQQIDDVILVAKIFGIIFLLIGTLKLLFPSSHANQPIQFTCKPNLVVARDGTGNFKSVMEAVEAAPLANKRIFCIFVKSGVYEEAVSIARNKTNIILIGERAEDTVIHSTKDFALRVAGSGFIAAGITIKNAGNPKNGTAALYSASKKAAFYRSRFIGTKSTLYLDGTVFFRDCEITGSDLIIYGSAAAFFQNSTIYVDNTYRNDSVITYHGGNKAMHKSGFVFQKCSINSATSKIQSVNSTYLGSPGGRYSRVVIMESFFTDIIKPAGWISYDLHGIDKVYFGEYNNSGPGGVTEKRVRWPGFKILNKSEAATFTLRYFFNETAWFSSTRIPHWED